MIDGMILELLANKATGTTHSDNTIKTTTWVDTKSTYSGSLINFNFTNTSGWIGTGTDSDPYRLAFDGINDYVSLPYIMDYDKEFSIETRIKVPMSGTGVNGIFNTMTNINGAWITSVGLNLDTKKIVSTFGYYGVPETIISSADSMFDFGDILDLAFIYKTNNHVEIWCNGIKVIDNVFNATPYVKSQLCLGALLPKYAYPSFYKVEIISFRIFDRLLTSREISFLYTGITCLIKQFAEYYSIKSEYYDANNKMYTPLSLLGGSVPNTQDIENYGFNVENLTKQTTIGTETFKPIDKLANSFEVVLYKPN